MSVELAARIEAFLSKQPVVRSIQSASGVAVGTVKGPRPDNQDRAAGGHLSLPTGESLLFGLICDGMGGMTKGGEAASCAAATFISRIATSSTSSVRGAVSDALAAANHEVYRRFKGAGGTTLTALVLTAGGESWVAHVGDSRLYEIGSDKALRLATRDDTIGGQLAPTGAADETLDNRLLQFVGMGQGVEPHVFRLQKSARSSFLITSDGAHSIGKRDLEGISRSSANGAEVVRKLIYVAEAVGVEDNSSAVTISPSDFEVIRPFGTGTEVTLWSPTDKLEMWLGGTTARENRRPADSKAVEPDESPKKKSARAKPRAEKKAAKLGEEKPATPEKPQLNIEFGSKGKDRQ